MLRLMPLSPFTELDNGAPRIGKEKPTIGRPQRCHGPTVHGSLLSEHGCCQQVSRKNERNNSSPGRRDLFLHIPVNLELRRVTQRHTGDRKTDRGVQHSASSNAISALKPAGSFRFCRQFSPKDGDGSLWQGEYRPRPRVYGFCHNRTVRPGMAVRSVIDPDVLLATEG